MKNLLGCLLIIHSLSLDAQLFLIQNSTSKPDSLVSNRAESQSRWFKSGNIDFISSGLLRSSADVLILNIGNPERFHLPFYLVMGATADIIENQTLLNEIIASDLINNKGGFISFGIEGINELKNYDEHSKLNIVYLLGAKSISGINPEKNQTESFLSVISNVGLMFETTAWSENKPGKKGKAWVKYYLSASRNDPDKMTSIFGSCSENYLFGSNIEGGIHLRDFVNLSFGYYRYLNNTHLELFSNSVFKLSADFFVSK